VLKPLILSALFACTFAITLAAAPIRNHNLGAKVQDLISRSPAINRGHIGYRFVDLQTGAILAEHNAGDLFTPASNVKLFTTAMALIKLGPNYEFQSELRTNAGVTPGQTALPDLQIVGGGDPNISGRALPYQAHAPAGDPLAVLKSMAGNLVQSGVREIDGDVTGVSTRYEGDQYPDGWTVDDSTYGYGAPVTSLALNDNVITITLRPSAVEDLAEIELSPASDALVILNGVVTDNSNAGHIEVRRVPGTGEVVLWGTLGLHAPAWSQDLAVPDPGLFAAEELISVLREKGVIVRGSPRSQYLEFDDVNSSPPMSLPGTILASHRSAPLSEEIRIINKESQNLHAEMVFRESAVAAQNAGTLKNGRLQREAFLAQAGIPPSDRSFVLTDGSGLARQDLATPESLVRLLQYMWTRPERDVWLQSLPIGAFDGSLEKRFQRTPGAARIHAKTGSISHVNSLSGYIERKNHTSIAFSIIVNATAAPDADVRDVIDRVCALFLQ